MKKLPINCIQCNKTIYRDTRRVNEAKKFGWNTYCSIKCQSIFRNKQQLLKCSNCNSTFKRQQKQINAFGNNYCSRSCAAEINNVRFPKRLAQRKTCVICQKTFISREKYCSVICKNKAQTLTKEFILKSIQSFYTRNERIPLKREFPHSRAAQERFGSWNNAIKTAGFYPNPVMFAKKYIAKDGHKCDSLAEKIIDDWLHARRVNHIRSVPYPSNHGFTADFVIGEYWIEFFGLYGEHKRYDELRKEKLLLTKRHNLKLIEIYPHHLFPQNKLEQLLKLLLFPSS